MEGVRDWRLCGLLDNALKKGEKTLCESRQSTDGFPSVAFIGGVQGLGSEQHELSSCYLLDNIAGKCEKKNLIQKQTVYRWLPYRWVPLCSNRWFPGEGGSQGLHGVRAT